MLFATLFISSESQPIATIAAIAAPELVPETYCGWIPSS